MPRHTHRVRRGDELAELIRFLGGLNESRNVVTRAKVSTHTHTHTLGQKFKSGLMVMVFFALNTIFLERLKFDINYKSNTLFLDYIYYYTKHNTHVIKLQ